MNKRRSGQVCILVPDSFQSKIQIPTPEWLASRSLVPVEAVPCILVRGRMTCSFLDPGFSVKERAWPETILNPKSKIIQNPNSKEER